MSIRSRWIVAIALAFSIVGSGAMAQVYVAPGGAGSADGTSWDNAFGSIQDGVDAAADVGEDVWVAMGAYTITETIVWPAGVAAYGGFPPEGTLDERDPFAFETVLQAQDIGGEDNTEGTIVLFDAADSTGNRLDGFTLTGADSDRGAVLAGASAENVEATVANCSFVDNHAGMGGAATADESGGVALHLENCRFINNSANALGGAVLYRHETSGSIINCVFVGNSSGNDWGGGSAIFSDVSTVEIDYCTFYDNTTAPDGDNGSFIVRGSGSEAYNSIFWGNSPNEADVTLHNTLSDEDPLFVDPENGDLGLQAGSPAIDQGEEDWPATDIRGVARPQGAAADLGAYEYIEPVTVPDVTGETEASATTLLEDADLVLGVVSGAYDHDVPEDSIISQDPEAGASVIPGSAVSVIVSLGPPAVVPVFDFEEEVHTVDDMEAALADAGLTAGNIVRQWDSVIPEGLVVGLSPAPGSDVAPGSAIDIIVSDGPPPPMPVAGVLALSALAGLGALGGAVMIRRRHL